MKANSSRQWGFVILCSLTVYLTSPLYPAALNVQVFALSKNVVILNIDGQRRVLRRNDVSPEGVKLIHATTDQAVVEIEGVQHVLQQNMVAQPVGKIDRRRGKSSTLIADKNGFFYANGTINGRSVRFLVDTGANTIAMSSVTARQLGLDTRRGQPGRAATASGMTDFVAITLNSVSVGDIKVNDVRAAVLAGSHPRVPLLGGSFLRHVKMTQEGNRMQLEQRL